MSELYCATLLLQHLPELVLCLLLEDLRVVPTHRGSKSQGLLHSWLTLIARQ
jgi:hypothetical protein